MTGPVPSNFRLTAPPQPPAPANVMKISHLSRITTAALLLIVILFSAALLWPLQRLDDAFRSSQDYQALKDSSRTKLLDPMRQYLNSDDTTLLRT